MSLKKIKKRKNKPTPFSITYKKHAGSHVYRSAKKDAPFSEWTRLTEKPVREGDCFTDRDSGGIPFDYHYMMTDVDVYGNESEPYFPNPDDAVWIRNGKKVPATPENTISGMNYYWSENPDAPLDRWTKINDEPLTDQITDFECPIKTPFYIYGIYVNALGEEMGKPSDIQYVEPKP